MNKEGILVVISGFSGAGKGTLVKKLIETYDRYALSVSMTTRNPRPGEMDGVHYFFTSKEDFEKTINEGGLIEYANYCGNYYGTPKEFVDRMRAEGKDVILEIEVQGALQIKEKFPTALLLFVTPPDAKELKKRLYGRQTETEEVIQKRLNRACEEVEWMDQYDYIIVNDSLDECVENTHHMIEAAHSTPKRSLLLINNLREGLKTFSKGE
ncbi:MAG: guanylate kinase [Lachnospiraceae bacterium]|nr:guanylate kinase [Lachnospiraceae bacterium]